MLLAWMTYALLVSLLGAAAALAVERLVPRGARWAWAGALALGWGVPVARAALERWSGTDAGLSVVLGPMAPVMDAAMGNLAAVAGSATAARMELPVAAVWAASSAALSLLLLMGWLRVRVQARRWEPAELEGTAVLLTDDVGPAVVGVIRPRIVVPRWILALTHEERRLILDHEEEHRRKKDPALLAGALLAPLLAPWNPVLWLGFLRLRHAVETDCDARVLARGAGSPLGYAQLLFQVGTLPGRPVPLGAGFGERTSSLERRIRTMLEEKTKGRAGTLVGRSLLAAALVLAACSLEVNIEQARSDGAETEALPPVHREAPAGTRPAEQRQASPTFTPFTVAPTILNREEVVAAMEASYPPLLREAGVSGTVRIYFFVDETGRVTDTRIDQSSGHEALDDAALRVASVYRFRPALNRDEKVPVWVSFPITFQVR